MGEKVAFFAEPAKKKNMFYNSFLKPLFKV
jgi:hypothetical protein